jgi:hypothetical protein
MRELHLPEHSTERDLELAEDVARAFDSLQLLVCWSELRGPCAPGPPAPVPPHPLATLVGELAGGLVALWEMLVSAAEQRPGSAGGRSA